LVKALGEERVTVDVEGKEGDIEDEEYQKEAMKRASLRVISPFVGIETINKEVCLAREEKKSRKGVSRIQECFLGLSIGKHNSKVIKGNGDKNDSEIANSIPKDPLFVSE